MDSRVLLRNGGWIEPAGVRKYKYMVRFRTVAVFINLAVGILDRSTDIHGLNTHLRVSFKHSASYRLCEQSLANFFQTGKSEL